MNSLEISQAAGEPAGSCRIDPWRALMLVLLSHLERVALPESLQSVFAIARSYWSQDGGRDVDLVAAKEQCWAYLKSFPTGSDVENPEGRLARALLCVLEPGGDDDEAQSMTADWFAAMLTAKG